MITHHSGEHKEEGMGKELKNLEFEPWSYKKSIEMARTHYQKVQKYTLDLVRELYFAYQALSNSGYRSDLTSGQMSEGSPTWESYCDEVGINVRTAYRWRLLYDPIKECLLTPEEFKARKLIEFENLIKQLESSIGKAASWRPDGWSTACENYYQSKQKELKYQRLINRQTFDQAELFNREYLASLSNRFDTSSPEDILEFGRMCEEVKPYAVPSVSVPKQVRVVKLVEAALAEFQPTVRPQVAKFIAEMIIRMGVEE
jgi:hypothetical protein